MNGVENSSLLSKDNGQKNMLKEPLCLRLKKVKPELSGAFFCFFAAVKVSRKGHELRVKKN
ncbi:MAG: hypothetical protein R6U58_03150 [Bacteroidales bacterium]